MQFFVNFVNLSMHFYASMYLLDVMIVNGVVYCLSNLPHKVLTKQ